MNIFDSDKFFDCFIKSLLFLVILSFIAAVAVVMYDSTELQHFYYKATLVDKWHKSGSCEIIDINGTIICEDDHYIVSIKTAKGLVFKNEIVRSQFESIPTNSRI